MLKKTHLLRKLLIALLIICLAILSVIFINQYKQYKEVEPRLVNAYSSGALKSPLAYKLFSIFNEADYFFRLYTINHQHEDFEKYKSNLSNLQHAIDSIAALPLDQNPLQGSSGTKHFNHALSTEFANLKMQLKNLIVYGEEKLTVKQEFPTIREAKRITSANPVIQKILQDTSHRATKLDTIVRQKKSLIQRIFNAKNDTLVTQRMDYVLNTHQVDVVQHNIEQLIKTNENAYKLNFTRLRNSFKLLEDTEREVIISNYTLLNNLKESIDKLNDLEQAQIREAEEEDFSIYYANTKNLGVQLILALVLIFIMILIIIYYQRHVHSYEKKLVAEKDYASKVAEEKNSILANVSHEIRAPLNSLQGIVRLLRKDSEKLKIDQEIIQSVDSDISMLNTTIDDILNLSKLESGSSDVKKEFISVYQLVEDIIHLHLHAAKNKKLELINQNRISPDLLINTNAFRVRQVVSNLVSNAIKYTKKGSVTVKTSIDKKVGKDYLRIDVVDTGIGIEPSLQNQIFRKYYTVDANSKKGFGLGLHISQLLAEQIDGVLNVTSELGKGSTFSFEMRIVEQKTKSLDHSKLYKIDDLPADIDLVFIDDSRINLFFIQQMFNNKRSIQVFENSEKALAFIKHNPVDYVITDLVMPNKDGWEVLKEIKSNEQTQGIKVIACTAESMLLETKSSEFKYTFDAILKKPIQEQELVEVLK